MLSDDMLRFVFVYDARFADALTGTHVDDLDMGRIRRKRGDEGSFVVTVL